MTYVLNFDKKPLTPCHNARARRLLKQGKAKVYRKTPFTIKLTYQIENPKFKELTVGIDTGSKKLGAAVIDDEGNIYYLSEVELRNDIKTKMDRRRMYRRTRRNRKLRYRKCRFLNRRNSIKDNRYPPTLRHKYEAHMKELNFICSILPVTKLRIETGTFDPHAMLNPSVRYHPWMYQKGPQFGYYNTKACVLSRDNHTCQFCKGKSKDKHLEVHHILEKSQGGSDRPNNLVTLCHTCHQKLHKNLIVLTRCKLTSTLKHATHMNILCSLLKKNLTFEETFGYISKVIREAFELPKAHCYDALAATIKNQISIRFKTFTCLLKKCISSGDYKLRNGVRSQQIIPTGKIKGFRKFDEVLYQKKKYFIKGRMSTGYAVLMNIANQKINLRPMPKFNIMQRLTARKSWITSEVNVVNTCCCITAS